MSTSTPSYSSLLDGMWGPEGSDINERLKRLQNLDQMRKDREAKRQAMMRERQGGGTNVGMVSRLRSTNAEGSSSAPSIRRTLSMNEESGYGGARPKLGSYKLNTDPISSTSDVDDIFGDIKANLLSGRQPMQSGKPERSYESRSRYGSSDSDDSYTGSNNTRSKFDYSRSYTNPVSSYSNRTEDIMKKYMNGRAPYTGSRFTNNQTNGQNGHSDDYSTEQVTESTETANHEEIDHTNDHVEDDEEPKQFIERLRQGNHDSTDSSRNFPGSHNSAFVLNSMPTLPPYKHTDNSRPADLPELVQPTTDILSVAQEISATFGLTSPGLTPSKTPDTGKKYSNGKQSKRTSSKKKSGKKMAPEVPPKPVKTANPSVDRYQPEWNDGVTYEIVELNDDSSGDERGKTLPVTVRESLYNSRPSEWGVIATTPGKVDTMHEFFNGDDIGGDPNISRELDGESIKAEFDRSFSEVKSKKSDRPKTPSSGKKNAEKEKQNGRRSKSPLDRLKNSVVRTSESENDSGSVHTSGSDNEVKANKNKNRKSSKTGSNSTKQENKDHLSIEDKLAKLESMTQEKKRKHSIGEKDESKPVPSYMSSTSASNQKRARNKGATTPTTPLRSATPTRDLKKDVRELKQYVRENSVPSTPVDSPVKSFTDAYTTPKRITNAPSKEISVQTEYVIDFPDINYVCKHCGKSSLEEVVSTPLTLENLNKSQKKMNGKKEAKSTDGKFSSKDSVKSLGDNSTKSERATRYTKRTAPSTSQSYMKGTTSSRLKNSGPPSEGERGRKGSAPELIHKMEGGSSLRGTVSQKTKVFENKSRAKSSDRKDDTEKRRLRKSKSVDHVSAGMQQMSLPHNAADDDLETTLTNSETVTPETSPKSNTEPVAMSNNATSPTEKRSKTPQPAGEVKVSSPQPLKPQVEVGKLDLSSLQSPPQSPGVKKPPLASPRLRETGLSPKSETHNSEEVAVESKGQFTSIGDNPFIKKDGGRTRTRSQDKSDETVWEKAESRSRESSLKRSNSSSTGERRNSGSSLKRHNTSAGEKSSVSELTWSDSGSTESLSKGSKSSFHGSNSSLSKEADRPVFHRPRTMSTSSTISQNSMLNLLSPPASTRHPVSGAIETDVDAAYYDHIQESKHDSTTDKHNEDTVNKAHLDFAKNACNMLEFEMKKRDSSNESDKGTNYEETKCASDDKENFVAMNGSQSSNINTAGVTKHSKKEKSKKGLFKGKLFKK